MQELVAHLDFAHLFKRTQAAAVLKDSWPKPMAQSWEVMKPSVHRTMERSGLEWALKSILFQHPCHGQG